LFWVQETLLKPIIKQQLVIQGQISNQLLHLYKEITLLKMKQWLIIGVTQLILALALKRR